MKTNMTKRLTKLSKCISYVLRHNPSAAGIELDEGGWVDIDSLCRSLKESGMAEEIDRSAIEKIIESSEKKRFEIVGDRIRATYGHSLDGETKIKFVPATPPDFLYHGTSQHALHKICGGEGILPMERQYVHLSSDVRTAIDVGRRHDGHPAVITVDAARMFKDGFKFFHSGNDGTWMCENVPSRYISNVASDCDSSTAQPSKTAACTRRI